MARREVSYATRPSRALMLGLTVTVLLSGCGKPGSTNTREPPARTLARHSGPRHPRHHRQRARPQRLPHPVPAGRAANRLCPASTDALTGVYHPARLAVLRSCQKATGTVVTVRHEPDGDLHIDVALDRRYRFLSAPGNATQHGWLVVEFMARDGGHLPEPGAGQRISLIGVWVTDMQHGWNELHPVWAVSLNGSAWRRSGPQYGGSPPSDRSSDAEADCRTPSGNRCRGYGLTTAQPEVTPRRSHHTSRATRVENRHQRTRERPLASCGPGRSAAMFSSHRLLS